MTADIIDRRNVAVETLINENVLMPIWWSNHTIMLIDNADINPARKEICNPTVFVFWLNTLVVHWCTTTSYNSFSMSIDGMLFHATARINNQSTEMDHCILFFIYSFLVCELVECVWQKEKPKWKSFNWSPYFHSSTYFSLTHAELIINSTDVFRFISQFTVWVVITWYVCRYHCLSTMPSTMCCAPSPIWLYCTRFCFEFRVFSVSTQRLLFDWNIRHWMEWARRWWNGTSQSCNMPKLTCLY